MIHKLSRLLMTLVALFAMTAGAWATTDPNAVYWDNQTWSGWTDMETTHTVGDITITCSGNAKAYESTTSGEPLALQAGANDAITFTSNGKPFASIKIMTGDEVNVAGWTWVSSEWTLEWSGTPSTSVTLSGCDIKADMITFTFAPAGPEVTWNAATKTGTFTQPGYDVVLTPLYAPTAAFATTGTEPEVKTLLPEAAEGVIAGTDAPLIAEGTGIVAFAGTSTEVRQGTVMYAVTPATVTDASELIPSDWKNTVPTAKNIADNGAELKVWYYIQGADAPQGVAATLDNTFNNSDIASLNVSVRSNKFDLTLKAANANTIDATQASKGTVSVKVGTAAAVDKTSAITDEGKLTAIKMGSEVKLNAKQGYKFRKVEVKKAGPGPLTYATKEGAVTRIKFNYSGSVYYADFTYSNGSFTRTGGSGNYVFNGSWTMKEENGVLTMTANFYQMSVQFIYFVCTFYVDTNEYTASSTGNWNYSFSGIEVNGTDITDQLTKVK